MSNTESAIEIRGLTKKYDGFTLDNIDLVVPSGSILGFIGQNGAGKTTTIRLILNLIKKDRGSIKILGMDNEENEYEIKSGIAAVFDELPFHECLNANQLSTILSYVYDGWDKKTFNDLLERFCLPRKRRFGDFSKGMKMKLQIAAALSHGARLLIMDEATTGLDPVVRNEILDIFLEFLQDENNSIFLSSHITTDLERIADRVTFIDKGRILLSGDKDETVDSHGLIKCTRNEYKEIDPGDFISARLTDFGAEVMVSDKKKAEEKYSGLTIDNTTLEEIMLFYVRREKKEWK